MKVWQLGRLGLLGLSVSLSFLSSSAFSQEHQAENLEEFLQAFHQKPFEVMDQLPFKIGENEEAAVYPFHELSLEELIEQSFVVSKDQVRKNICAIVDGEKVCVGELSGRAAYNQFNDNPRNLTDNGNVRSGAKKFLDSLEEMEAKKLLSKKLSIQPWSDDYWAIAEGILSKRYGDPSKPSVNGWKEAKNFVEMNPTENYITSNITDLLSPAEKYDLLINDKSYTMTNSMWTVGQGYYNSYGKVETWMGICHGWAPAAYMLDRPKNMVKALSSDGKTEIVFYPSDIKSLGSLLWANLSPESRFVGGRCNAKKPAKDANGRVTSEECFDTNPGTWHMAVVNQIGVSDRSFVMDATFDYEVWNQPVVKYSYRYFNPQTLKAAATLAEATVARARYSNDKFSKYRAANAASVVGIEMDVSYVAETQPSHNPADADIFDYVNTVTYRYDLELDNKGNIIGGEWYGNAHPDFLWTPEKGARAGESYDRYAAGDWSVGAALPKAWATSAKRLANPIQQGSSGSPLPKIVEELVRRAK